MANRKEYEMLFKLNSQLGSSFSGSFQKAQKELAALQRQVEALNKSQSDIKAYQKQQESISKTEEKLRLLQQQYDNIQREMQETGSYSSDLENKLLAKQQQIDRTNASLSQQKEKLEQMSASLKDAGVDTENLTKESERLAEEIKDCKEQEENFGNAGAMAFDTVASAISAAGITAALKEIYDAYMECVSIAGDFEEGMSNVEAISGATAEEMEFLSGKAKELGATTKFTAQEAADAMGYMAMAGWDAQEMLSGMDGVLQLAAASGEDLAMVSDIVTDNLTAFGLTAADTARFADVLAAAATNSNTNVSIMGETFKMSASVAGALGYSVEDVAVAVGLMANSGIKGSIAGTALKNTFNGLLEGVTLSSEAFGEYDYTAIKANGTMKSFSETIDELRIYFDQMTEAERVNNAMTIAGQRGYNGLLAILNATDEDYASLTESINNCTGAAQEMASVKLDNMNGELTIMKSAWDGLKISIGEQFTPAMQELYALGTDVLTILNDFVQKHPALVKAVAAFTAAFATLTTALVAFAAAKKIAAAINLASLLATAGPILAVVAAVSALTAGIVALATAESEEEKEIRSLTAASRKQYTQLQDLTAQYEAAMETYGETSDEALALRYEVDQLTEFYTANKKTLEQFVAENDALIESHDKIMASFSNTSASIDNEEQSALALALKLGELTAKTELTESEQKQLLAVVNALNDAVPDLALSFDTVTNSTNKTADAVKAAVKAQAEQEREAEKYQTWVDLTKEELALKEQLADAEENLRLRREELTAEGWYVDAPLIGLSTDLDDYQDEVDRLTAAYAENQAALDSLEADMASQYTDVADDAAASTEEITLAIGETKEKIDALTEAYQEVYDAALESVHGQYELWDEVETVAATSASTINSNLQDQITYWQEYNANLANLRERTGDIEGLSEIISSFADGSTDSVNAVAGMAAANDEELAAMVKNWQALQEEQNNVADNIAELKTNFSSEMDKLGEELAADIEAMDLCDEATAAGEATLQGYIDAANGMLPQVQAAYQSVASAAVAALYGIRSGSGGGSGGSSVHNWAIPTAYAGGTQSAERGFAMVGEHGPELVYFGGGEQVFTAEETAAMQHGVGIHAITFAPQLLAALNEWRSSGALSAEIPISSHELPTIVVNNTFHVEGNATQETIEALTGYGDGLKEVVKEALEEISRDSVRTVYR